MDAEEAMTKAREFLAFLETFLADSIQARAKKRCVHSLCSDVALNVDATLER